MAEDQDGETTFSPTNSSKEQLNADCGFQSVCLLMEKAMRLMEAS